MKTNLFNTTGEYTAPECKTLEIQLEESVLAPVSGEPGAAGGNGTVKDENWG